MSEDLSDPRAFRWVEAGISGIPRKKEWDAVTAVECKAEGDECALVRAADEIIVLEGSREAAECAAASLADELQPPYRAVARRREANIWAVGAVAIEVVELPADTEGQELMLTVTERGERALEVDGRPAVEGIEALERGGGSRFDAYVLRATRIRGRLWEIGIDPL
jgi:hypothetical protein